MSSVASATRGTPMSALPPERSIRHAAPTIWPGCSAKRGQALARGQAGGDDVLDHQHALAGRDGEAAPELEDAVLALDEDRLGAEPARGLVARNDAADRRRGDDVDRPEGGARLARQRAAQALGARRVLKDEHLLQEDRRAQSRGQDEMPLEKRAGGAEFVERLFGGEVERSVHRAFIAGRAAARKNFVGGVAPGLRARRAPRKISRAKARSLCRCAPLRPKPSATGPTRSRPTARSVRLLLALAGGSFAHFELPAGAVSHAVAHRSVEEIWYFSPDAGGSGGARATRKASSTSRPASA